jgi:predicted DCC family thiol-disulfide oxidoreductase YuxK
MTEPDYILYDGQCPACAHYIAASGIGEKCPGVELVDARSNPDLVAQHGRAGRDIDESMVVVVDGVTYSGADATRKIAEIAAPSTPYARWLLWAVGRAPWARALYPVLARGRRGLLRLLGRDLIRNGPGRS